MVRRKAVRRPPRKPIRAQVARPPRAPIRHNPITPPMLVGTAPPRPGPTPEMVGEDFVVPEVPVDTVNRPPLPPRVQRPRWEGVLDPSRLPGGDTVQRPPMPARDPRFDLSQDVMDALMEMLVRGGYLGGRAY